MIRRTALLLLCLAALPVCAQRVGFLSYGQVMRQMPEYAQAQEDLLRLKAQFDAEAVRGEDEFQRKFTEFLQGQKDFPQNIMLKRQAELQSLMETAVSFRIEGQRLLDEEESKLMAGVGALLDAAIKDVATEMGYLFVLNTDSNQCPYVSPTAGEDITYAVMLQLGLVELPSEEVDEFVEPFEPTEPVAEEVVEPAAEEAFSHHGDEGE